MTVGELRTIIKGLPKDMPVGLLDLSTDDAYSMSYMLKKEDFEIQDYYEDAETDNEPMGKALFICFDNKLNENPITDL